MVFDKLVDCDIKKISLFEMFGKVDVDKLFGEFIEFEIDVVFDMFL